MQVVSRGPIQAVSRAADILRCFLDKKELSLAEISRMTGLHKSTCSTLVTTLKNEQLLSQDADTLKYRLGLMAYILGSYAQVDILSVTRPFMVMLNEKYQETVNLGAMDGTDIVYIDKLESAYSMRTCTKVGQKLPFYCTAIGKCLVSQYSDAEIKDILDSMEYSTFASKTVTDPSLLWEELLKARENGCAIDREELENGLCCYAAPIFNSRKKPIAAVSISGPIFRIGGEAEGTAIINDLKEAAKKVTEILSAKG